jgi:iron complex transport system ATP-binding protein
MHELLLQARGLTYAAGGVRLVDGVSLTLHAGEVLCLVGPNGAGKSTLLRLLTGELRPESGEVLLGGRPLSAYSARELALKRAVLPQQTVLQFAFSARDVVLMGRNPHIHSGWVGAHDLEIADESMRRTETSHLAARAFPSLSGGEQTRVTIARVLAQQTPVLLLDEPSSSLDVRHQEQVMAIARQLAAAGAGLLVILHDLNLASAYADTVALMHGGRLAACGYPGDVLREAVLSEVFECPIRVVKTPEIGQALIIPDRSAARVSANADPVPVWISRLREVESARG